MDDLIERAQFLFGLDRAPDDIESFFVEQDLDAEDGLGLDADLDETQRDSAMRTVVASVIMNDGPAIFWDTARRLLDAGMDRRDALDEMAYALRKGLNDMSVEAIDELPMFLEQGVLDYFGDLPVPNEWTVGNAVNEAVAGHQGITVEELVPAAVARLTPSPGRLLRFVVADRISDQLDEFGSLSMLPDDRIVHMGALGARSILTHRLSAAEIESDCVHGLTHDLCLFGLEYDPRTPDGTAIRPEPVGDGVGWAGPSGWLSGFRPGDLIGLRVDMDGRTRLEAAADQEPSSLLADQLRETFDRLIDIDPVAVPLPMLVSAMLIDLPDTFAAPQAPLTELVERAGLRREGSIVGTEPAQFARAEAAARSARMHDAANDDCDIADAALEAFDVLVDVEASEVDLRRALRQLGDGRLPDGPEAVLVRDVVVDELVPEDRRQPDPDRMRRLGERVVAAARRSDDVAMAHWLAGMIAERTGEVVVAEAHFHASMIADAGFEASVDRCAWYASDRGDAATAARLWRSIDGWMVDDVAVVERFARSSSPRLGRNDPCWCGSGRKFKACHQGQPASAPLPERVSWLCRKAASYLLRRGGDAKADLIGNLVARAGLDAGQFDEEALTRAAADPLPIDAALTEGGWFARFLEDRGSLLPDDERLLATSWLLVDRSVHEVERVDRGVSLELRDLRTGDMATVTERTLGTHVTPGVQICARVVPDGAGHQIVGGVFPVRVGDAGAVLDLCERGDPRELCRWAARLQQPPSLQTREGEAMVDCTAVFRVADAPEARWVLDGMYEPTDGGWHELHAIDDDERLLRATLRLDGDELTITATAAERIERAIDAVRRALPDAVLVSDRREPIDTATLRRAGSSPRLADLVGSGPPPASADAQVIELQEQMERRWLTEPVPALGNVTPIEAAADPTRRRDVERLLDTFPVIEAAGMFGLRPDKLREALGL